MIKRLRNCNGQTWFKTGLFGQSYLSEGDKALWQRNFKSCITLYKSNPAKRMIILETTQCATLYDYIFMNLKQLPFWGIAIPRKTGRYLYTVLQKHVPKGGCNIPRLNCQTGLALPNCDITSLDYNLLCVYEIYPT